MAVGIYFAVGIGVGIGVAVGSGVDVGGTGVLVGCSVGDAAPPHATDRIRIDARARQLRIFHLVISGLDCQF